MMRLGAPNTTRRQAPFPAAPASRCRQRVLTQAQTGGANGPSSDIVHATGHAVAASSASAPGNLGQLAQRRSVLLSLGGSIILSAAPADAEGFDFFQRGLQKYIKKKKLDPLDTYVPVVLDAKDQLTQLGTIMVAQPAEARQQLRSGPFDGLRSNIRALGEYAVINKQQKDAGPLVNNVFKSLEAFDVVLANAVRNETPVDAAAAQSAQQAAIKAIDDLLSTVPEDVMIRSQRVLDVAREKERAALLAEEEERKAAAAAEEEQRKAAAAAEEPAAEFLSEPVAEQVVDNDSSPITVEDTPGVVTSPSYLEEPEVSVPGDASSTELNDVTVPGEASAAVLSAVSAALRAVAGTPEADAAVAATAVALPTDVQSMADGISAAVAATTATAASNVDVQAVADTFAAAADVATGPAASDVELQTVADTVAAAADVQTVADAVPPTADVQIVAADAVPPTADVQIVADAVSPTADVQIVADAVPPTADVQTVADAAVDATDVQTGADAFSGSVDPQTVADAASEAVTAADVQTVADAGSEIAEAPATVAQLSVSPPMPMPTPDAISGPDAVIALPQLRLTPSVECLVAGTC